MVDSSHPQQNLLFFMPNDFQNELRNQIATLIAHVGDMRAWTISAPIVVDVLDSADATPLLDNNRKPQFGVLIRIYSALSEWKDKLPQDVDCKQLKECEVLVKALEQFSAANGVDFEGELDDVFVGEIRQGHRDKSLTMFLGEWRRTLAIN